MKKILGLIGYLIIGFYIFIFPSAALFLYILYNMHDWELSPHEILGLIVLWGAIFVGNCLIWMPFLLEKVMTL